ncbi:MAG: glutamate--tRNA ligase [Nanoarchaeota archaeon]|nr:glutamate--tRNA ligase [Nanoarchaeota archaeon]MBU1632662.1 glutamate--tRNA ligase [Nanoarchaeota archaeon]MBU1875572.1 glutamate--tRNA ligase [Nanoarchaeota archaeon]
MKETILKHVLKNALDFDGKANPKVVLGLVLKENPDLKGDVPKLMTEINKIAINIEQLPLKEIKKQLQKNFPELLKEKEEKIEGPLKPLPNAVKGKVVVRIAPSPSGPMHVGHAYGASLNYEYAKMYEGKFIVRIEDTNPENLYSPAYDLIPNDAEWLTDNNVTEVIIQSSRLGIYYDCAEKLVSMEKAYVCTCDADEWRELKNKGNSCPCRKVNKKENLLNYAKMFNEYAEGEAVLRLKTDIKDKNPAMRDFPIMRINEHIHPKIGKEQRVWPLMVFSVAVDDHELGITHVLNGKDHTDNAKKEILIMDCFGWKHPEYKHWGMINFEGLSLSSSKTKLAIEQGEFNGWDDIRLPFLPALRRRGYQAGAFRKYALEIGLSLNDKSVTVEEFWKNINAFNREIIEIKANRYFFVDEPVEVNIENALKKEVSLDLHPDFPKRGARKLNVKGKVYISESDRKRLGKSKIHRLMDYCNFEITSKGWKFVSESYEEYKNAKNKGFIIHWLPSEKKMMEIEVVLEDNTIINGFGENEILNLKEGDIVQLERRYFARLDKKEKNKLIFWYLHK